MFRRGQNKRSKGAERIVVHIDDDEEICNILEIAFKPHGFRVESTQDPQRGLELIQTLQPDAVVLDMRMPKLNGFQILAQLQQDPATSAIPVVIFSGVDNQKEVADDEWGRRLGVRRFVAKPAPPEAVLEAIQECLKSRA